MMFMFFYRIIIGAYGLGIRIFSLFNAKAAVFVNGRRGLLAQVAKAMAANSKPVVWIHCASLGEFEQGRPVLEAIKERYPNYCIVLTFFSPSGYEVRKNYPGADYIFYLPMDSKANAVAFIDAINPKLCLFIKYELWYYYLAELKARGIPTLLVSAIFHPSQGFFKWYGSLQRKMLGFFTQIFVQDEQSMVLLAGIGIKQVTVSGDTRFDRVIEAAKNVQQLQIAGEFCKGSKMLIAGSTWKEDELLLREAFRNFPVGWKLILVPHEVDLAHIQEISALFGDEAVSWSAWQGQNEKRVLVVDKVGLLMQLYSYGDIAWIGGGFGKAGVHNVLEPAVYGMPCLFGPIYARFLEAVEMVAAGAAKVIATHEALLMAMQQSEAVEEGEGAGEKAKSYVFSKAGATDIVMRSLSRFVN